LKLVMPSSGVLSSIERKILKPELELRLKPVLAQFSCVHHVLKCGNSMRTQVVRALLIEATSVDFSDLRYFEMMT